MGAESKTPRFTVTGSDGLTVGMATSLCLYTYALTLERSGKKRIVIHVTGEINARAEADCPTRRPVKTHDIIRVTRFVTRLNV